MFKVGVPQKSKGAKRAMTVFATLVILAGLSLLVSSAALAHAPDGWQHTDFLQGNGESQEVAGDLYYKVEDGTVYIHWHVDEAFEGEVTDQFVCIGSYPSTPPDERCKPGQADEGTVFKPEPIGDDEWSFEYDGDVDAFQLHLSIGGETLIGNGDPEVESDDDGTTSDDDGTASDDDGTASDDDGTASDDDDGTVVVDDNTQNTDGSGDEVLGRTVTKPLAQTGPETTVLAWFGLGLLMVGATIRFGRFGSRAALATGSPAADELVAKTLALIERTVRPGSRNWDCHR